MRSPSIPPLLSTQAPSASPAAPLAGTSEPAASSDPPICQLLRQPSPVQKIGPNMTTYDANDRASSTVARASQAGIRAGQLISDLAQPGSEQDDRPEHAERERAPAAPRRRSVRGWNSSGSSAAEGPAISMSTEDVMPSASRMERGYRVCGGETLSSA